jgi:quercetin dioxygenase-like cupin family protein
MASGPYGRTSGTDLRESRPVMERLMVFSLEDELGRLRNEQPWREGDRNSRTLAKDVDFRVLLTVLRDGAQLEEEDGDARVSLHLLEGRAQLKLENAEAELERGEVAVVDAGNRWVLRAAGECALLLTLAWPREKADV